MIEQGQIVFSDTMEAFNNYMEPHSLLVKMENPPPEAQLLSIDGIDRVEYLTERQLRLYFKGDQNVTERVIEASVRNGWHLREIGLDKTSIDEIFKQLSSRSYNGK